MRSFTKFFSSVRLAIILLILITLASVLGTLIPQGRSAAEYTARYGSLSGFFTTLQLTRLYRSPWYLGLLVLFALNIVVCSLTRIGAKWRKAFGPAEPVDAQSLMTSKVKNRFRLSLALGEAGDRVTRLLRARRYRVSRDGSGGRVFLLARKKRLGGLGSDVVHLGLLVILAGGLISGLAGRRSDLALREGETAAVPGAAFSVRLDKFETEYYPQGGVKDWKSTVSVIENGAAVASRVVEVNHPLTHRGVSFYQTSYGYDWDAPRLGLEVRKRADASFMRPVTLKPGETVAIDDPDLSRISVRGFVPDFVIGEGSQVQSRSNEPRNPAALVEAWKGEERVFAGWVFAKYPDFGEGHTGAGAPSPLAVVLKTYDAAPYSVLQAARDPGANFIWLGSLLVTAGLFLAFYWPPREVRVVLEEAQGRVEVTAAGRAAKGRDAFQAEFDGIFEEVRRAS